MVTLSGSERSQLERAVLAAREAAEHGVRKRFSALDLLGISAPPGISESERQLRNALRDRARKLGRGRIDPMLATHEATRAGEPFLIEEIAYETWHRMVFARYLAENDLLIHPEFGVPLSITDITELAAEQQVDTWDLAAEYAGHRLPGLFHLKSPLQLATEDRQDLTNILVGMSSSLFTATDSLGWVYQYWQSKRKDEVNASGDKITGNTLSPVTQLFTEDYMVDFLLQNSLGAWYVSRFPSTSLPQNWPYLRYRDDCTPAAGTFPTWPDTVAEVKVIDPCCGSGHFLVAALHMLVEMRQERDGLSAANAADAVLRDNLFGLELDARCTQIATFAVVMEAWKLGGRPEINLPHIACSGIPVGGQKEDWLKLARGDDNLVIALENLYEQFSQANELGSLINPRRAMSMASKAKKGQHGIALAHDWSRVEQRMRTALQRDAASDPSSSLFDPNDDLVGTIRAAELLGDNYTLVVTNVPFLSRSGQGDVLKSFSDVSYPVSKGDLATVMLQRCLELVASGDDVEGNPIGSGTVACVTPHNWLFRDSFKELRSQLIQEIQFDILCWLGPRAFRAISGEVVNVTLAVLSCTDPISDHAISVLDVTGAPTADTKSASLEIVGIGFVEQFRQMSNPDHRILSRPFSAKSMLSDYGSAYAGITTGDYQRFGRKWWEVCLEGNTWSFQQSTVPRTLDFGGRLHVMKWDQGTGELSGFPGATIRGKSIWGKEGIAISQMGLLPVTRFTGELFDDNAAALIPLNPCDLTAIWCFCSSHEYSTEVRSVDAGNKVWNAALTQVPFDLEYWQKVAAERYPNGLPEPYSSDPTQWLFEGTVPDSEQPLHVAMARLLGYRWPDQVEDGLDALVDNDGIVTLPSLRGEPAADHRLRLFLQHAYGDAWSTDTLPQLLRQVEATSLESWLRDKKGFFTQHLKLFHNRPFLWQISDGAKDGFSVIVNYHRFDQQTLNKLTYTYLGDWITRQKHAVGQNEAGAPARLEAATALQAKLTAIATGEPPYDIYVRWKSLAEQPIGWNPDLNDGVRLNIRPFVEAGVLHSKVNVKWGKDRGRDPEVRSEPLAADARGDLKERIALHCSVERHNDLHFILAEKQQARALQPIETD